MTTYDYKGKICVAVVDDTLMDALKDCTHLSEINTGEVFFDVPNKDFIVAPRKRMKDKLRRRLFEERPNLPIEK